MTNFTQPGSTIRPLFALVAFCVATVPVFAQPPNGGLENGDLSGWTAGGGASVEALQAADLSPSIPPTEGSWFALLSTGPGNVPGALGGDFDANGTADEDSTTLAISFTTTVAGESLSFDWAFLTSEVGRPDKFDDLFDVTIDGISILSGSVLKPGGVSPFPDTAAYDGVSTTVASTGPTDGSQFTNGGTPFSSFCIAIADPGTYTLKFLIADQGNKQFDSGLLIDNVQAPSTCEGSTQQITDTSGSFVELDGGQIVFQIHDNRLVAMSDDGAVLGLVSNADLTGDNPNAETQIFAVEGGAFERITSMVDGQAGRPSLTSNGRWLTFAATADPVGLNADGNLEIFRWDRASFAPVLEQVTTTTVCSNRAPTISNDSTGERIAFETDCTDLTPGFNADGNLEVVIWDANTGTFQVNETSGCGNRQASISQHDAGGLVSFISDCDLTGANPDGNVEVFQWQRVPDTFLQVTASTGAVNDGPSSSFDGGFVAFVSNADYAGTNADGSLEIFRFDRAGGTIQQLTDSSLVFHLSACIEDTGRFVAVERLDLLTFTFEVVYVDAATGISTQVAAGDPSFPAMAIEDGRPTVAFQSTGDFTGGNGDGNREIWKSSAAFSVRPFCRAPGLAIPDNDSGGVADTLTIADTGSLLDLDVSITATHSRVGDLIATLEHVATGTTVTLIDRPGMPPGNSGCSGEDLEARLSDEAANPVEDECDVPGPISIFGVFTPEQSLTAFDGEDLSGDWTLTISDNRNANLGNLVEWCLLVVTP